MSDHSLTIKKEKVKVSLSSALMREGFVLLSIKTLEGITIVSHPIPFYLIMEMEHKLLREAERYFETTSRNDDSEGNYISWLSVEYYEESKRISIYCEEDISNINKKSKYEKVDLKSKRFLPFISGFIASYISENY